MNQAKLSVLQALKERLEHRIENRWDAYLCNELELIRGSASRSDIWQATWDLQRHVQASINHEVTFGVWLKKELTKDVNWDYGMWVLGRENILSNARLAWVDRMIDNMQESAKFEAGQVIVWRETGERGRVIKCNEDGSIFVNFLEFGNSDFSRALVMAHDIKPEQ
jgi:hypothetical protein